MAQALPVKIDKKGGQFEANFHRVHDATAKHFTWMHRLAKALQFVADRYSHKECS